MRRDYTALIGLLDEFGIKDKIDFAFDWSVDPMRPVTAAPAPPHRSLVAIAASQSGDRARFGEAFSTLPSLIVRRSVPSFAIVGKRAARTSGAAFTSRAWRNGHTGSRRMRAWVATRARFQPSLAQPAVITLARQS